ncbi:caspase family protein, partial [Prosthecodimorpha hirschii]|uniref:caspase family protein n=1 Tax=Prosthecodimorpha hirschii TaxID=665126 RepID=UPI0015E3DA50
MAILAMAGLDGGPAGAAGKRVALVIGNAAYPNAPLVNAVNDADAMEALFKKAGFDAVIAGKDLDRASMSRILDAFQDEARGADIAVVFYSGHGIEVSGMNYLVPVDARLTTDREVKYQAIPLDDVLASLDSVAKLRLVLLDACRDNPFLTGMKRVATKGAFTRGLARAEPVVSNTLIGYATGPGRVAFDGEGGLSPFTAALVEHLTEPGVEVEFALRRVRDDVIRSTRDMARRQNREPQEPYRTGSIGSEPIMLGAVGEGAATGPAANAVTPSIAPVPSYDADAAALGRA